MNDELGNIIQINKINDKRIIINKENDIIKKDEKFFSPSKNNNNEQVSNLEPTNIVNGNSVPDDIKEQKLDDTIVKGIEFVIRLLCFENKLLCKIKNSSQFNINDIKTEYGFIINDKIIECYKIFYNAEKLWQLFNQNPELKSKLNIYKNKFGYISENVMNDFINEVFNFIPKDYIKEIQEKNNSDFLSDLQKKDLYKPLIKFKENQQFYYFVNSVVINEGLGKLLLNTKDIPKIYFIIANDKFIVANNFIIYIGVINEKIKYIPEILINCQDFGEIKKLFEELKIHSIQNILQDTKRINNNIPDFGIYKNTNTKIIIIQGNYNINKNEEKIHVVNISPKKNNHAKEQKINIQIKDEVQIDALKNDSNKDKPPIINNDTIIKKEIKNIIDIIIDFYIIRRKRKVPLNKNSKLEKYYLININWIKKYNEYYKLSDLYKNQIIHKTLQNIINNMPENLSNEIIFENARLQPEFNNLIYNYSLNIISNNYQSNIPISPVKKNFEDIFYYINFFLITENTAMELVPNYSDSTFLHCYCNFGDNEIFISFNGPLKYFIEVYYFDKYYNIVPEIFLRYYGSYEFSNSLSLLLENGYENFKDYYLLFANQDESYRDYTSPIFDKSDKEIGYAYIYDYNIKDYSPYIISNEYKKMIKLYFYYIKLNFKSNPKTINQYYLINKEYIKKYKDHYKYSILEQSLSKNNFVINEQTNIKEKSDYNLSDKSLTKIIKSLPNEINKNFIEKDKLTIHYENIQEEPLIKRVLYTNIYYYDDFEFIDKDIYFLLFNKNSFKIYQECYFMNKYICIKMPKKLNSDPSSVIYIFGSLNQDNIFNTKYLLEYNSDKDFIKSFESENQREGFEKYINSFKFKNNIIEQLIDFENNPLGFIYNLSNDNENDKNNENNSKLVDIKNEFHYPPLIGLKNVDFVPYMNAFLQIFCQIEKFLKYIKYNIYAEKTINKYDNTNTPCLTKSFKILIDSLWPSKNNNNKFYIPLDFKNKLILMNPSFKSFEKIQPKELINFIIMK